MDTEWTEYQCKSGETLFIYNKVTGEHKWPTQYNNSSKEDNIKFGQPIIFKELCSIATQTDDYGCSNGCSSMYIDTGSTDNNMDDASQPHPTVLGDSGHISVNAVDGNSLKNASAVYMDELSSMLSILEEMDLPSEKESVENSTQATDSPTDDINSHSQGSVESHLHGNGKHTGKKPCECSHCDKKDGQKTHLTTHHMIHTGERPFKCTSCDKTFRHKMSLTGHLRIHTGEKPFQCSYCDKKFRQKSCLTTHLRIHTGEKPYTCPSCDEKFRHKISLTGHIQSHTGKKPFQCSYCDKRFGQKIHLTTHLRIHTGEKPYKCPSCDKKFRHDSSLTWHLQIHTGKQPYIPMFLL